MSAAGKSSDSTPVDSAGWHRRGLELAGAGSMGEAVESFRLACAASTDAVHFHDLGVALVKVGRFEEAGAAFRAALQLNGNYVQAAHGLGAALMGAGRLEESAGLLRQVVQRVPDHFDAWNDLGSALEMLGRTQEAIESFVRACASGAARHFINLSAALHAAGRMAEAQEAFAQGAKRSPDEPSAWNELGEALIQRGRLDTAIDALRRACSGTAGGRYVQNLGRGLFHAGRFAEAAVVMAQHLAHAPQDATAWGELMEALARLDGQVDGRAALERELEGLNLHATNPQARALLARVYRNVGEARLRQDKGGWAVPLYRRALELSPDDRAGWTGLGSLLLHQGKAAEAVECFRKASAPPIIAPYHSNVLYASLFHAGMTPEEVFAEHLEWDRIHAHPLARKAEHQNNRNPARRIRVGYLSPGFREHPVMVFLESVLANHDREQLEIFCYSNAEIVDETGLRLRAHADAWRPIMTMTDEQVASQIESDRIDVLVDLHLHMADNRALVFARRPAPVQINYLAYSYSSGMRAMDWRITDQFADPPGMTEKFNTEKLLRLEGSFYCYRPPPESPDIGQLPSSRNGAVTFGALNQLSKISPRVVRVWAEILKNVPGSRLMMLSRGGAEQNAHVLEWFEQRGIDRSRLSMFPRASREIYLRRFNEIDLALDPFPYTGHTTSCECLWMGVPFVTLAGAVGTARMGASVLGHAGVGELVAQNEEEYVRLATDLARDCDRLALLRRELRGRMERSAMMDQKRVARQVEEAYRSAWAQWCVGGK